MKAESEGSPVEDERGRLPARRLETPRDWSDLVLAPESRDALERIAALTAGQAAAGAWTSRPKGEGVAALFRGPSGTGKTLAQALLGKALGHPVWAVDLAGIVSKYIGETEKVLDRIFHAAEAAGAILAIDEADALFGKRSEVKDAHDRYANLETAWLLQRLEAYRGLSILATNRPQNIDPAFVRRFGFIVDFAPPDAAMRLALWRNMLGGLCLDGSVDPERLAFAHPLTGGAIADAVHHAARLAAGAAISEAHLRAAIAAVQAR
jgi:SpoVK/Ycf46/Vps4 family AAA+-type ATPase